MIPPTDMRIPESCAICLYDRQKERTDNEAYLAEVKSLIDNRSKDDTSPYIVYQINQIHRRYFGREADYSKIKKTYNDLVLGMEGRLREQIEEAPDPVAKALIMARIGNYIDFGAMNHVDKETFLSLFDETEMRKEDRKAYESFLKAFDNNVEYLKSIGYEDEE